MIRRTFLKTCAALGFAPMLSRASPQAVPRTCAELYDAMCAALPVGEETWVKWSVTGEEYVEYAVGVAGPEEHAEATACRWMWNTFRAQFAKAESGSKIYWRIRPEFAIYWDTADSNVNAVHPDYQPLRRARIYARYLISAKPAIYSPDQLTNEGAKWPWPMPLA